MQSKKTQVKSLGQIGDYKIVQTLGSHQGGLNLFKVELCQKSDGNYFALKVYEKKDPHDWKYAKEDMEEEVETYEKLNQLQSPHVIKMYEYVEDAEKIFTDGSKIDIAYMVLEYIPRAEVFYYLAGNFFNDDVCRHLFLQMLDAVEFLHNNNISHRDLKPENLLFDDEWKIRVIDFNFSAPTRGRDGTGILTTFMGQTQYLPPEAILHKPYAGHVCDVFAIGVILFTMYAGHPPFRKADPDDPLYKYIFDKNPSKFWQVVSSNKRKGYFIESFKDLFNRMMMFSLDDRLHRIDDIREHTWCQGIVPKEEAYKQEFFLRHKHILENGMKGAPTVQRMTTRKGKLINQKSQR